MVEATKPEEEQQQQQQQQQQQPSVVVETAEVVQQKDENMEESKNEVKKGAEEVVTQASVLQEQHLCIVGIDKHWIEKDLIKYFRKAFAGKPVIAGTNVKEEDKGEGEGGDIPVKGLAKKRGKTFGFLQFEDLAQKTDFVDAFTLTIAPVKRYRLRPVSNHQDISRGFRPVKATTEMAQDAQRRKEEMHASVTQADVDAVLAETIEARVTPYAELPYPEQLQRKHADLKKMLIQFNKDLNHEIKKNCEVAPTWYVNLGEGRPMPLEPEIIHTEVLDGYRNKVEFTVGRMYAPPREGVDELWNAKAPICVGFNRGNLGKGISFVERPDNVRVISAQSVQVAKSFEQIVHECPEEFEPFDKASGKGFWRILLYRESKVTKQVTITVVVSKSTEKNPVPVISEEIKQKVIEKFPTNYFGEGEEHFKIVSLSVIVADDLSGGYNEGDEWLILSGNGSYAELLCGLKFTVSPFAFFQVNTQVFEKMLALITDFAGIDKTTVLFDICCGTGAIGLCLSHHAKKVIGVELVEQAVENAKLNVQLNEDRLDASKIQFFAGRAETVLPPIVNNESSGSNSCKIVGIVDPPRAGLHKDVLRCLRTCRGLDRLVYVSCNAQSQVRDLKDLCYETKKSRRGPPFRIVKAVGADLFPHTNHIESIVLLERSYE